MKTIAGLDFGGTHIKMGLIREDGKVLPGRSMPFHPESSFDEVIQSFLPPLKSLVSSSGSELTAIGISTPGYADPDSGVLIDGVENVAALRGRSLPAVLGEIFGLPVSMDNDGTCAATGELLCGAGRDLRNFVLITLGTGIGGGVVVNGEVVTGPQGEPPEIGAICLQPEAPVNYSGIPGTFEHLACASGLVNLYVSQGGRRDRGMSPPDIFEAAARGDQAASAAVDRFGRYIAQALGIMINILNPDACLLGGGISGAGEPLLEAVRTHLPCFTWPNLYRKTRVIPAGLGNNAGWIGAAAIAGRRASLPFEWKKIGRPIPPQPGLPRK